MKELISIIITMVCFISLAGCQQSEGEVSLNENSSVELDMSNNEEESFVDKENIVEEENIIESDGAEVIPTGKIINPYPTSLDIANLQNAEFDASFNASNIYDDAGVLMIDVNVYESECFDVVELNQLEIGDIIVLGGKEILVEEFQNVDGVIKVNGGCAVGGHDLEGVGGGIYVEITDEKTPILINLGKVSLKVDQDFELVDNADEQMIYLAGDLFELMKTNRIFSESSTRVRVENGNLISITSN